MLLAESDCWITNDSIILGGYGFFLRIESCPSKVTTDSSLAAALMIYDMAKILFNSASGLIILHKLLSFESYTAMIEAGTEL